MAGLAGTTSLGRTAPALAADEAKSGRISVHYEWGTLKEVVRCTRDGITVNTFMLERSPYMVQFINDLMRINNGRVFVATPDRLGEYILVDYVANKRKWVG